LQLSVHHLSVATLVKARHLAMPSPVVVGLSWSAVDDTDVMVVESDIAVVVERCVAVVSTTEVVASCTVVLLESTVVVAPLHLHDCGGQKGVTWLQLLVHH